MSEQNQKKPIFPAFDSDEFLLSNPQKHIFKKEDKESPKLKPNEEKISNFKSFGNNKNMNLQILPLRKPKKKTFVESSSNDISVEKESSSKTPTLSPKINPSTANLKKNNLFPESKEFDPNPKKIFSAQLRKNNHEFAEYFKEKVQESNSEFKRKDRFKKMTRKLNKQYSRILFAPQTLKFKTFSQLVLGLLCIKSYLRKKRAKRYVELFSHLLEGKADAEHIEEATTALINFNVETLHSKLIKRSIHDPFFIHIIEKFSYNSILREYRASNHSFKYKCIFFARTINYCSKALVTSKFYNILTVGAIIVNSFCLYQEFSALEETIPMDKCVNLTAYPPQNNSFHIVNELAIYYFFFEMMLKILAFGVFKYFKSLWNIADMVILYLNYHYMFIDFSTYFQPIPIRIFKFVNLLEIKALKIMVKSLGKSLILLSSTFFIFLFMGSVYAICGVQIFSGLLKNRCFSPSTGILAKEVLLPCGNLQCPGDYVCWKSIQNLEFGAMSFDDFGGAFLLVLRTMTLSVWTPIMYSIQRTFSNYAWMYFFSLIIIGNFFLLNLNLAVLKVKFSQNYGQMIEKKEEVKKYGFKMLLQRKVIRSSREVTHNLMKKGLNLSKAQSQVFWKQYGAIMRISNNKTNDIKISRKSIDISMDHENVKKRFQKKPPKFNFREVFFNLTLFILQTMKSLIFEEAKTGDLVNNNLEIVVSHEQEYYSLSINDIFHDRENSKIEKELQIKQNLLKKQKLAREYSFTQIMPKSEKIQLIKKKTTLMDSQIRKKSLASRHSSKLIALTMRSSIKTQNLSNFSEVAPKKNVLKRVAGRMTALNNSSPMKSARKNKNNLKKAMEKKLKKNENVDIDVIDYLSVKKAINEKIYDDEDNSINYMKLYVKILESDIESKKISKYHWSGTNVLPSKIIYENYWKKLFSAFSQQDFEIWMSGILGKMKFLRKIMEKIINSSIFTQISIIFVILNLIILSFEGEIDIKDYNMIFNILTHFFFLEFCMKICVYGINRYFAKTLNRIDAIILFYSLGLIYFSKEIENLENTTFKSLRLLRTIIVFRAMKLLSYLEYMNFILLVLSTTFNYFIYIAFFLILMIVVFSLISKQIYSRGCDFSSILDQEKSFSSFASTIVTIFNFITLDNWNTLITATSKYYMAIPMVVIAFLLIFLGNFIILNLFIAIMLDSFDIVKQRLEEEKSNKKKKENVQKTNKQIYMEIKKEENFAQAAIEYNKNSNNPPGHSSHILDNNSKNFDLSKQMLEGSSSDLFSDINEDEEEDEGFASPKLPRRSRPSSFALDFVYFKDVECKVSLYLFSQKNPFRKWCYSATNSPIFEIIIYILIILVGIILALDTFFEEESTPIFAFNVLINIGFIIESLMKIVSLGLVLEKGSYMRNRKNSLDLLTIILSIVGLLAPNNQALKGILLIRLWRPLSIIYKRKYINDLLNALISSLYQIMNVFIVVFLVWFVFSLIGIQLYRHRFGYCAFRTNFLVPQEECLSGWIIYYLNFDNIKSALITIFVFSTMDNWANLLQFAVNSDLPERGPSRYNNQYSSYMFFLAFIIIAIWLFFNLFIGVIFSNFMEISRKNIHKVLSSEQIKWLELQKYILKINEKIFIPPTHGIRFHCYRFVNSKIFDYILSLILSLNFLTLILSSDSTKEAYWFKNLLIIFSCLQFTELALKLYVYRTDYFRINNWNGFNLLAAIGYIPDLLKDFIEPAVGNKIMRMLSGLKILSLIRIIEKIGVLKALIMNLLLSWRLILNMILLLFIIIFIYAVIGVYMFKNITQGESINEYNNFKNLFYALMTLFKCVTREEWTNLLFDSSKIPPKCTENVNCGSAFAPLYFISFMILNTYIIFNLFILILLQQFEEFHKNSFNPMVIFKEHLPHFKKIWNQCCIYEDGCKNHGKIHIHKIIRFYQELGAPLGLEKSENFLISAKKMLNIDLKCNLNGMTFFNEVLYSTMRSYFKDVIFPEEISQKALRHLFREEREFYFKLEENRMKKMRKGFAIFLSEEVNKESQQFRIINPLYSYFYFSLVFNSWKNFSYKSATKKNKEKPLFHHNQRKNNIINRDIMTIHEVIEEESPEKERNLDLEIIRNENSNEDSNGRIFVMKIPSNSKFIITNV